MTYAPDPEAPCGPQPRDGRSPAPPVPVAIRHQFVGAKGGQGTTTVALALAGAAPGNGPHVLGPQLHMVGPGGALPGAIVVEDLGRLDELDDGWAGPPPPGTRRWLVVRGPCYRPCAAPSRRRRGAVAA